MIFDISDFTFIVHNGTKFHSKLASVLQTATYRQTLYFHYWMVGGSKVSRSKRKKTPQSSRLWRINVHQRSWLAWWGWWFEGSRGGHLWVACCRNFNSYSVWTSQQVVKSRGKDAIPVEEPTDPLEVVISKKEKGSPSKSSQPTTKVRKLLWKHQN